MGGGDFQKGAEGPAGVRVRAAAIIARIQRRVNRFKSDREKMITDHCKHVMTQVSRVVYKAADERKEYATLIFVTPKRPKEETWQVTKRILTWRLQNEGLESHIIRQFDNYDNLDFDDFPSNWDIGKLVNQTDYNFQRYGSGPQLAPPFHAWKTRQPSTSMSHEDEVLQMPPRLMNAMKRGYSDQRETSAFSEAAIFLHWNIDYPDPDGVEASSDWDGWADVEVTKKGELGPDEEE